MNWISSHSAMPEVGQEVLVYVDYPIVWDGHYVHQIESIECAVWNGSIYKQYEGYRDAEHVTHWMPLPTKPRKELCQEKATSEEV